MFLLSVSILRIRASLKLLIRGLSLYLDWEILSINSISIEITIILDWISFMFISFVCFISSMVLFYRGEYIRGDINVNRFIYLVLGFVFSILLLIISPNLIRILLGWDGLGLVSYALVIYYQNEKSAGAGILTALSNRVGDVAILLSIALISSFGGWSFIFYVGGRVEGSLVALIVLASITKSAQIPFSAWLPAAMAAPTPVSALVHSSTLVTAGVYLLIRFRPCLKDSWVRVILFLLGRITIFMAGLGANFETDLKKIIALSTLSQLGVMIRVLSLGWRGLAFFHLLTHALFKALLFICAGSIIHRAGDSQDIRTIGGLVYFIPLRVVCLNLANLSLCGFPFLAGFYSKDLILEIAFLSPLNEVGFWLYCFATGLTVCYTFRLVYYRLRGDYNLRNIHSVNDEGFIMTSPIIGLGLGAIIRGSLLSWAIFPAPIIICLTLRVKILPLMVRVVGALVGYFLNLIRRIGKLISLKAYNLVTFAGSIWFLPYLSVFGLTSKILFIGSSVYNVGDRGWTENWGGQGSYTTRIYISYILQIIQENRVKLYIIMLLFWLILFILI